MAFNYTPLQSSATALIQRFGKQLTFTRVTKGAYDPNTGQTSDSSATYTKYACVFDYSNTEVNDTTILQGDRRLLAEAGDYEVNDTVSIDSKDYRIISISENKPSDTQMSVNIQVRA